MNVLAIGDSLFAGTTGDIPCTKEQQWIGLLAKENNWNLTNLGIAGQTMAFKPRSDSFDKNYNIKSIYHALYNEMFYEYGTPLNFKVGSPNKANKTEVNIILLEGGCNDFNYFPLIDENIPANTLSNPQCFKGAYKLVIDKLLVDYPNACIACITPWKSSDASRNTYYGQTIIDIKNECYSTNTRVGVINAANPAVSGVDLLNSTWKSKNAYDNFHLKPSGMRIMANNMLNYITTLENNNYKFPSNEQIFT